jgi:uncharacterized membrane protein YhhN
MERKGQDTIGWQPQFIFWLVAILVFGAVYFQSLWLTVGALIYPAVGCIVGLLKGSEISRSIRG